MDKTHYSEVDQTNGNEKAMSFADQFKGYTVTAEFDYYND